MSQFSIGDTVQLKCGGPKMTLAQFISNGNFETHAECAWFDTSGRLQYAEFPLHLLTKETYMVRLQKPGRNLDQTREVLNRMTSNSNESCELMCQVNKTYTSGGVQVESGLSRKQALELLVALNSVGAVAEIVEET